MLAREFVQRGQLGFALGEALRIEIERALIARKQITGLAELDLGRVDKFADGPEPFIEGSQLRKFVLTACEQPQQREFMVTVQTLAEYRAALQQLPGTGQATVTFFESRQVFGSECMSFELVDLMAQPVDPFGVVGAARQSGDAGGHAAPCCCRARDFGQLRRVVAECIEQGELLAAFEQCLVLMLAMNLDESLGEGLELGQGDRAAVDPRARAAFATDHAAQLAGSVLVEILGDQPVAQCRMRGEVERGRQFRAGATVAHHRRVGAGAGEEQECVDQKRFAGAGLSGHHGQAAHERDFSLADDREILDMKTFQHRPLPLPDERRNASMRPCGGQDAGLIPGRPTPIERCRAAC